jgi:hypothetical protein
MRTRTLATIALVIVTATAGCGFLLGDEPATFVASPATVSDDALSETGYEETNVSTQNISKEFSAAGQTREVIAVNHLAKYERQVSMDALDESKRAALFTVFTSPEVSVLDRNFNPIDDFSERDILQRFDSQYEDVSVGEKAQETKMDSLDAERNVSKFEGTSSVGVSEVDVYIHAAKLKLVSDHIAVVAIYPRVFDEEDESATDSGTVPEGDD